MSKPIIWTSIAAVLVSSLSLAASGWVIAHDVATDSSSSTSTTAMLGSSTTRDVVETKPEIAVPAKAVVEPKAMPAVHNEHAFAEHAEPSDLKVRRFVITSGVKDREPVDANETFEVGENRVYAFVEMANRSSNDGEIVIVFEHVSTRAGMVRLEIPGSTGRWRTWGYSRALRKAGTWHVVVREEASGKELARKAFSVTTPANAIPKEVPVSAPKPVAETQVERPHGTI